jgi:dTDP-D-glucose 4,6-dehydratase
MPSAICTFSTRLKGCLVLPQKMNSRMTFHTLGWQPRWDFEETIERTANWYRKANNGADALDLTRSDIADYSGQLTKTLGL